MDWAFDHLQLLFALAAAIAYWIVQRRQRRGPTSARGAEAEPVGEVADPDERTRRIREEIRRRIAERQGQAPAEAPGQTTRRFGSESPSDRPGVPPPVTGAGREATPAAPPPLPSMSMPDLSTGAELLTRAIEEQRQIGERFLQLEAANRSPAPLAPPAAQLESVRATEPAVVGAPLSLRNVLGQRKALRQAILLREILGPPKGLR